MVFEQKNKQRNKCNFHNIVPKVSFFIDQANIIVRRRRKENKQRKKENKVNFTMDFG